MLPAGLLTAAAAVGAARLWPGPAGRDAAWGLAAAWLLASGGTVALLAAKAVSARAFWWAFWAGVGSRLAVLGGLIALGLMEPRIHIEALLVGYAVGLAFLLPLELKRVPLA